MQPAAEGESEPSGELGFPVVGVGASAGGLEAMEQFLQHLPADAGVALIFVQHLSPRHVSNLTSILPRSTKMSVCEASDGMRIERDTLYVIPPDRDLAVMHGTLQLLERPKAQARHMPVDYLFRSLAQDQANRSIGVVLSGTGFFGKPARPAESNDVQQQADRLLLSRYAPPGVIVDQEMQILHFRGQTGRFLEPAPGAASLSLLRMARPGLALDLRAAIHEARTEWAPARRKGVHVQTNGGTLVTDVSVHPLGQPQTSDAHFLVLFEPVPEPPEKEDREHDTKETEAAGGDEVKRLRRELQQTKATMQGMLEEIIPQDTEFDGFELVHDFPGIGRKRAVLDARRIDPGGDPPNLILLTVRELSDA